MKRLSQIALLLAILCLIFTVAIRPWQSAEETEKVSIAPPAETPSPAVSSTAGAAQHATRAEPAAEKSAEESPVFESSWGKELRALKELAARDADAALAQVARMPDKHERKSAAQAVCLIVAEKDAAKAMLAAWNNDLGKFTDEASENVAVETLAKQWAEADLAKAFVWASALPPDDEARRDRVVKGIALALAQVAPAEAAAMVAKQIHPDSTVHIDAAIEVLRTWASQEYSGAMAWASLFPAGALRERSAEELANVIPSSPTAVSANPN